MPSDRAVGRRRHLRRPIGGLRPPQETVAGRVCPPVSPARRRNRPSGSFRPALADFQVPTCGRHRIRRFVDVGTTRPMTSRAIEIRRDHRSSGRVPVLLVEVDDLEIARLVSSATAGRVQVVWAGRRGRDYEVDVVGTDSPLSEHEWRAVSGWSFRLGPVASALDSSDEIAGWSSAHLLVEHLDADGTPRRDAYALPAREGGQLSIGRGRENDVCLADRGVSRQHLRIVRTGGCYQLIDVRPAHGDERRRASLLDGAPLPISGAPTVIGDGAMIEIGETCIRCTIPASALGPFRDDELRDDLASAERAIQGIPGTAAVGHASDALALRDAPVETALLPPVETGLVVGALEDPASGLADPASASESGVSDADPAAARTRSRIGILIIAGASALAAVAAATVAWVIAGTN